VKPAAVVHQDTVNELTLANLRIRALEAALLEGVKAVNGLLAKKKELTAYKVAGEWRESVKALVVNYGTAEHPCSVPPPLETKKDCEQ
jgi:hypothetical protein